MREIVRTAHFKSDLKRVAKSGKYDVAELLAVVKHLASDIPLPEKCRDHALSGEWKNHRDCHIRPDWLLIYQLQKGRLVLVRTGSHAELFR